MIFIQLIAAVALAIALTALDVGTAWVVGAWAFAVLDALVVAAMVVLARLYGGDV